MNKERLEERYAQYRAYKAQGYTHKEVAEHFGISVGTSQNVCKGIAKQHPDYDAMSWLHSQPEEEYAKAIIDKMLFGFSYVGNYTGSSGAVDLRCCVCNGVFTQPFTTIRNGKKVTCPHCRQRAIDNKRKEKERKQKERKQEAEQKKAQKEAELFLSTYQVECEMCGKIFVTRKKNKRCCSPECGKVKANKASSKRKDKRITKDKQIDKGITARRLYKRDGGVCWICGKACDLNDYTVKDNVIICGDYYPSVDHVIAICDGGTDSWNNVRLAHRICNSLRYYNKVSSPLVDSVINFP